MNSTEHKVPQKNQTLFIGFHKPLKFISILSSAVILWLLIIIPTHSKAKENSYSQLLAQYVIDGQVDYQGLKLDEKKLDQYLQYLNDTNVESLDRDDQFAFYINAYNAYTLKLILTNFSNGNPPASIKDTGSFFYKPWSKKIVKINGKTMTLDTIEHKILRPTFKDPRVHFAVNCASKSCPPLISTPYTGALLDNQLTENTTAFLHNTLENRLEGTVLKISSIFKWFKKDFNNDPVSFFIKYSKGTLKEDLLSKKDKLKVEYLPYDWSLNRR